jgi:thioredoxin reductase
MMRTVDLVITGDGDAARAAAVAALRSGQRVLVVLRSGDARAGRQVRRCLCSAADANADCLTVMTRAKVVCVDGVNGVEAVVIRCERTGRLCAVNASAYLR